jgi:hypothetical protein
MQIERTEACQQAGKRGIGRPACEFDGDHRAEQGGRHREDADEPAGFSKRSVKAACQVRKQACGAELDRHDHVGTESQSR